MKLKHSSVKSLLILVIYFVPLVTPVTQASEDCPDECSCIPDEVWCESRGLTSVPTNIPVGTRRLFLFDNKITVIPKGSLSRLQNLQLLSLASNELNNTALESGVFSQLKQLQDLMLSRNKLTKITREIFSGTPNLVRLNLQHNRISSIDKNALRNLSNVVELNLSYNRLINFPKLVGCPNLRRLSLSENRLQRFGLGSFTEVNLEELELSGNMLNHLPSTLFHDISNLRVLDVSRNQMRRVPKIISNMTSLQTLNLSHNSITYMPENFLKKLRKMKTLDLGSLQLKTLNEGFIPMGVYLNFFDLTENPWECNCNIAWLTNFMRNVGGAIINVNNVKCNLPSRLHNEELFDLYDGELGCTSGPQGNLNTQHSIPPTTTTRRIPNTDLCVALACANGGTCYINETTFRPACRCLPGWKNVLCDEPVFRSIKPTSKITTSTLVAKNSAENSSPKLIIPTNSLTSHSVQIMLPSKGKELKMTISQVSPNGIVDRSPRQLSIFPNGEPYTVKNLEPDKKYNICISTTDVIQTSPRSSRIVEDKLCGIVTTLHISTDTPVSGTIEVSYGLNDIDGEKKRVKNKVGSEKNVSGENSAIANNVQTESSNYKLLVPVLGVGVGALIVFLAIVIIVCYRRKRKHATNHDRTRGTNGYAPKKENGANGEEVFPMVPQQGMQYTSQTKVPMVSQNGERYLYPPCGSSPQRISTPNKNGSLSRSSNSGGSVNGVQTTYPVDMQRRCPTTTDIIYSPSSPITNGDFRGAPIVAYQSSNGFHSGHGPYMTEQCAVLNNRGQDYLYRHHGNPDTFAETRFQEMGPPTMVIPVHTTATAVNHYHHRPIASTAVGPETTYHQINNTTAMPAYQTRTPTRQEHVPTHCTPSKQVRYPGVRHIEQYGPVTGGGQIIDNNMGHVFRDTLVM